MSLGRQVLLLLCVGGTLAAGTAHAQDRELAPGALEEARAAFVRGQAAYEAGRFEEALAAFERSFELTDSPEILYNIASVAERLRRDARAVEAYEAYLERVPDAEDRAHVEARIRTLRQVTSPAPPEPAEPSPAPAEPSPEPLAPVADDGPGAAPWIVVGVGAAVAVVGGALLGVALADVSAIEGAEQPSRWADYADAHERTPILSGVGIAALAVGGAAAVAGLVWALAGEGDGSGAELSVGPASITARVRF